MDAPSVKDYIDAKDEAILAGVDMHYAMTEARLAEMDARVVTRIADMETRVMRGMNEMIKWCVAITFAGMTVNITVSTYLYSSLLNRVDTLVHEVRALTAALPDKSK